MLVQVACAAFLSVMLGSIYVYIAYILLYIHFTVLYICMLPLQMSSFPVPTICRDDSTADWFSSLDGALG
jgi:hypothetical protein